MTKGIKIVFLNCGWLSCKHSFSLSYKCAKFFKENIFKVEPERIIMIISLINSHGYHTFQVEKGVANRDFYIKISREVLIYDFQPCTTQ